MVDCLVNFDSVGSRGDDDSSSELVNFSDFVKICFDCLLFSLSRTVIFRFNFALYRSSCKGYGGAEIDMLDLPSFDCCLTDRTSSLLFLLYSSIFSTIAD